MKIEEFVSEKNDHEEITIGGASVPVLPIKKLMKDGYVHLKPYEQNKTFNLRGQCVPPVSQQSNCAR